MDGSVHICGAARLQKTLARPAVSPRTFVGSRSAADVPVEGSAERAGGKPPAEMGAEQSADLEGKGGLATEILKLKAAKSGGWLSEEEFDTEVKRLIREHNGETREPAYAFNDVLGIMGDEVQMAEWEARYGDAAAGDRAGEGGHRPPPLAVEQAGSVELDLTGGVAVPSAVNSLLQEIEAEGGASIADLSDMQQGGHERGQGEEGVEAASGGEETSAIGGEATTTVEDAEATPIKDAPTTPKAQQVPTSDEMDEI